MQTELSLLSGHTESTVGVFAPMLCNTKGLAAHLSFLSCEIRRHEKEEVKRTEDNRKLYFIFAP